MAMTGKMYLPTGRATTFIEIPSPGQQPLTSLGRRSVAYAQVMDIYLPDGQYLLASLAVLATVLMHN